MKLNMYGIEDPVYYIKNLVYDLCFSLASPQNTVKPAFDISDIRLNIETAVPCGLIINELVSNSFKYAFPPKTKGNIYVSLKETERSYELYY